MTEPVANHATPLDAALPANPLALCDQLVTRLAACSTLSEKPKIFAEAERKVLADQLASGTDPAEIEQQCAQEATYWNDRFASEKQGC